MSEQKKVTRAEVDDAWNRFQDEIIAHAHDEARREQLVEEHLPELSSMIERCDEITDNRQDLVSQLDEHIRQLGLEAVPTKPPILYFEEKLRSLQPLLDREQTKEEIIYGPGLIDGPSTDLQPSNSDGSRNHFGGILFAILVILLICGIVVLYLHFSR